MKFYELPLQQSFEWEGRVWRKDSALTAIDTVEGTRKIIRRSAQIVPVAATECKSERDSAPRGRRAREWMQVFDAFLQSCMSAVDDATLDATEQQRLRSRIAEAAAQARQQLIRIR